MSVEKEIQEVQPKAEALAEAMGYEVLKIEFSLEQGQRVLRIFLDKPEAETGILIEDCAKFSRALGPILDVEVPWVGNYHLEISSPGLNRPLKTLQHFVAQVGKIVEINTEEPIEDRKNFKGELTRVDAEARILSMQIDQQSFAIPLDKVKKARLDYFATEAKNRPPAKGPSRKKKGKN